MTQASPHVYSKKDGHLGTPPGSCGTETDPRKSRGESLLKTIRPAHQKHQLGALAQTPALLFSPCQGSEARNLPKASLSPSAEGQGRRKPDIIFLLRLPNNDPNLHLSAEKSSPELSTVPQAVQFLLYTGVKGERVKAAKRLTR